MGFGFGGTSMSLRVEMLQSLRFPVFLQCFRQGHSNARIRLQYDLANTGVCLQFPVSA
jgi:hypothetical protein